MDLEQRTHRLPVETIERIIDWLTLHVDALRACSLTCREWRPRAQYHILSSIFIATTKHMRSFASFVSRFPSLAEVILRVRIDVSVLCSDVILGLQPLPNVHSLALSSSTKGTRLPTCLFLHISFPQITSLAIINCLIDAHRGASLVSSLSHFSALRALDLHRGTMLQVSADTLTHIIAEDGPSKVDAAIPLEHLSLNAACAEIYLLFSQRAFGDVVNLRRLELDLAFLGNFVFHTVNGVGLRQLLATTLPTLCELVLRADVAEPFAGLIRYLHLPSGSLGPGPNLKLLRISLGDRGLKPRNLVPLLEIVRALADPLCTAITISIRADTTYTSHMLSHGWEAVANDLHRTPVLCRSLTIILPKHVYHEHRDAIVEAARMLAVFGIVLSRRT